MPRIALSIALCWLAACTSDTDKSSVTDTDDTDPTADDTDLDLGDTDGDDTDVDVASDVLSIDTCNTNIADDVPAFYSAYFRCVDIEMDGTDVLITTTNLPPHLSPYYDEADPNTTTFDTMDGERFQNPNMLSAQDFTMRVVADPVPAGNLIDESTVNGENDGPPEYVGEFIGVSLDSVVMFAGTAAPGDDLEEEKFTFDAYEGHPQNSGVYHYHAITPGPLEVLDDVGIDGVELFAMLCDGALMFGCTELDGSTPDDSDFDVQNGHVHDISDGTTVHFTERYHTHACLDGSIRAHEYAPEMKYYEDCGNGTGGPP